MAVSKEDILDSIANMSVMDVVELVEAMEEKFGVSAASVAAALLYIFVSADVIFVSNEAAVIEPENTS